MEVETNGQYQIVAYFGGKCRKGYMAGIYGGRAGHFFIPPRKILDNSPDSIINSPVRRIELKKLKGEQAS